MSIQTQQTNSVSLVEDENMTVEYWRLMGKRGC